jgi:hypothetical protein
MVEFFPIQALPPWPAKEYEMQIPYRCCGGLDVHAKTVVACLIQDGKKQVRTFSTMTDELLAPLKA